MTLTSCDSKHDLKPSEDEEYVFVSEEDAEEDPGQAWYNSKPWKLVGWLALAIITIVVFRRVRI